MYGEGGPGNYGANVEARLVGFCGLTKSGIEILCRNEHFSESVPMINSKQELKNFVNTTALNSTSVALLNIKGVYDDAGLRGVTCAISLERYADLDVICILESEIDFKLFANAIKPILSRTCHLFFPDSPHSSNHVELSANKINACPIKDVNILLSKGTGFVKEYEVEGKLAKYDPPLFSIDDEFNYDETVARQQAISELIKLNGAGLISQNAPAQAIEP